MSSPDNKVLSVPRAVRPTNSFVRDREGKTWWAELCDKGESNIYGMSDYNRASTVCKHYRQNMPYALADEKDIVQLKKQIEELHAREERRILEELAEVREDARLWQARFATPRPTLSYQVTHPAVLTPELLGKLSPICDLIDLELPVLTAYLYGTQYWLQLWLDRTTEGDKVFNHWLTFSVAPGWLREYLVTRTATLRELVLESNMHIRSVVSEKDPEGTHLKVSFKALESDSPYLPSKDSYFDAILCPDLKRMEALQDRLMAGTV